jgi:hypothetical protein
MAKFWAHGTEMMVDSTPIGGMTALSLPQQSREQVELTAHDSEGWREFVDGLRDGGTVSVTCRFDPEDAGQAALLANFNTRNTMMACVVTLPDDAGSGDFSISFDAFVLDTGGSLPFDQAGEATFTLKIDGLVDFAWVSV